MIVGALIGPEFIIYTISGIAKRIFQKIERNNETPGGTENSGTINQQLVFNHAFNPTTQKSYFYVLFGYERTRT